MQNLDKITLEELIKQAVLKIKGKSERCLSRFLPSPGGGYLHHFTLRKMLTDCPEKAYELIQKHIIQIETPIELPPRPPDSRSAHHKERTFTITE